MVKKKSKARVIKLPTVLADNDKGLVEGLTDETKILLAGEVVFITDDLQAALPEGYTEQAVRQGATSIGQAVGQKGKTLRVAVASHVLESLPKVRFGFAVDGYLSWGLYQSRPTIVLGGTKTAGGLMIDILIFEKFRLIEKDGRVLPPEDSPLHDEALQGLARQLKEKYPAHRIVVSAPLPDFEIDGVDYIGDSALRRVSYTPVQVKQSVRSYHAYRIPALIAGAGVVFYAAAIGIAWMPFTQAQSEYRAAIEHPAIKAAGGVDQGYLGVMQQRRIFMDEPRRQEVLSAIAEEIVKGVATVPEVRILELKLPAPSVSADAGAPGRAQLIQPESQQQRNSFTPGRQPDASMILSLPAAPNMEDLDQARLLMEAVSKATGLDLRLSHKGVRQSGSRRVFEIEGVIRD